MALSDKAQAFSIDSILKIDRKREVQRKKSSDNLPPYSGLCRTSNTYHPYSFDTWCQSMKASDTRRKQKNNRCRQVMKLNDYDTTSNSDSLVRMNQLIGKTSDISTELLISDLKVETEQDRIQHSYDKGLRDLLPGQPISITHDGVTVSLDEPDLWREFHKHGTEMILNRTGRRMFPCIGVQISGLEPAALYSVEMEMVMSDNRRYKFIHNKWLPIGKADSDINNTPFHHPDSTARGSFWMNSKVSFAKVKITNNKENLGTHTVLHSMHKYTPVIKIIKHGSRDTDNGTGMLQFSFQQTSFIAVTAYQNEHVTQLKIQNNPFAKAFRDADVIEILQGAYMITGSPIAAYQALYGKYELSTERTSDLNTNPINNLSIYTSHDDASWRQGAREQYYHHGNGNGRATSLRGSASFPLLDSIYCSTTSSTSFQDNYFNHTSRNVSTPSLNSHQQRSYPNTKSRVGRRRTSSYMPSTPLLQVPRLSSRCSSLSEKRNTDFTATTEVNNDSAEASPDVSIRDIDDVTVHDTDDAVTDME
ncbi:uncharacterized protein LOC100313748 [Saccoglossus kowalevskii]